MKKTPWFPGDVKPVRDGVYETAPYARQQFFQFWNGSNGSYWGYACTSPEEAHENRELTSYHQKDKWRGLAKEPK